MIFFLWFQIYEVFPPFLCVDADVVIGGSEDVKSIDEDVGGGADDDDNELGKKCASELERLIVDFVMSCCFFLGGIVRDVGNRGHVDMWTQVVTYLLILVF